MKIEDIFKPKCKHRHTERTHPNCFRNGQPIAEGEESPRIAKVLVFDVETLPLLYYGWNVWNENIYPQQIVKDWCILSYSAKWMGDNRIISDILTPKEAITRDDKRLVTGFWNLLEDADVVVTHNGKRFDIKKLNTRFWKNGLHRPSSYKVIDTLTAAKSVFGLTYNKLDFIAKFIGAQEKLETEFELWAACDRGEDSALKYMREYNEQDAVIQEKIYLEMREWIPNHPDLGIYEKLEGVCPVCLSKSIKQIGLYTTNKKQYPEHRCSDCGSVWHDTKQLKEKKENGTS